jgi:RHS repeat-associated protein
MLIPVFTNKQIPQFRLDHPLHCSFLTQYERDNETGLDYAKNRYYASSIGRFTSVDPYNIVFEKEKGRNENERLRFLLQYISQPQIWNKYTYTINNPLKHTDPDGRRPLTKSDIDRLNKFLQAAKQQATEDNNSQLFDAAKQAASEIADVIYAVPDGQADPANLKAVFFAIDNLGNTNYGVNGTINNGYTVEVGRGDNKCNIFVANAYAQGAGIGFDGDKGVPTNASIIGGLFGRYWPSAANDLADTSNQLKNFPVTTSPVVGSLAAFPARIGLGHSGIYTGGGTVIYASDKSVKVETVRYVMETNKHASVTYRSYKP